MLSLSSSLSFSSSFPSYSFILLVLILLSVLHVSFNRIGLAASFWAISVSFYLFLFTFGCLFGLSTGCVYIPTVLSGMKVCVTPHLAYFSLDQNLAHLILISTIPTQCDPPLPLLTYLLSAEDGVIFKITPPGEKIGS